MAVGVICFVAVAGMAADLTLTTLRVVILHCARVQTSGFEASYRVLERFKGLCGYGKKLKRVHKI
jgi:hypothetical protein